MRKALMAIVAGIAALALISSCSKVDFNAFGNISGTVIDEDTGNVIADVTVTLTPGTKTTYTASDGTFEYKDLDATRYSIQLHKPGYDPSYRKYVTVLAGETTTEIFSIKRVQ